MAASLRDPGPADHHVGDVDADVPEELTDPADHARHIGVAHDQEMPRDRQLDVVAENLDQHRAFARLGGRDRDLMTAHRARDGQHRHVLGAVLGRFDDEADAFLLGQFRERSRRRQPGWKPPRGRP